jgi:hypothetical protein
MDHTKHHVHVLDRFFFNPASEWRTVSRPSIHKKSIGAIDLQNPIELCVSN